MGLRLAGAKAVGATLTVGLRDVLRRPAANMPGKIALYVDPQLIADLRGKLRQGSIVMVGTNGKTSTTNLLADALERSGATVTCNRTGANLDSGIATALLQQPPSDWGVFECDELWLAKVAPGLQPTYVLLMNLFRDQLDRCGEIDRIQESIAGALASSPDTVLVYNADDPLCAIIAAKVPNRTVAFGIDEDLELAQNTVADAQMCQMCDGMVAYEWRQYGQLGNYRCPACGFARPALDVAARAVTINGKGVAFDACDEHDGSCVRLSTPQPSPYMAYNLLATWTAAHLMGVDATAFQQAVGAFDPRNGRLQSYRIDGRSVLLNLAKNPTGFNQNLKIIERDEGPKAIAFFLNDREADGRDVSWIWDIDFEELAAQEGCLVFAGGVRAHDMQVRLKYAGIDAALVEGMQDVFAALEAPGCPLPPDAGVYAIANYTALPAVKGALDAMEDGEAAPGHRSPAAPSSAKPQSGGSHGETASGEAPGQDAPVVIAHMYPDLLNLYGDGGNVRILEQRLRWRGLPVEVQPIHHGEDVNLTEVDLVFLGGGPDREQRLASEGLMGLRDELSQFIDEEGAVLAICGGYQILGRRWLLGDEELDGLGIAPLETRRPGTSADRLIGDIALDSPLATRPVIGYENHAGRTYLDSEARPFGTVTSHHGKGNNDESGADGVLQGSTIGTYLHGPLLAKNPEVADWLLERALARRARRTGIAARELAPLDDSAENAANEAMAQRLGA